MLPQATFQVLIVGDCEIRSHIIYLLIKNVDESSGEAAFHAGFLGHRHQSVPVTQYMS